MPLVNAFEAEAGFTQGVTNGSDMSGAARLERHIDDGFAEADTVVGAVVDGLSDVGALACQNLGEGEQCSGAVLQVDANAQQAAVFDQAAFDDLGQQADVDVAAADQHHGAAMAKVGFGLHDGSERGGARSLGEGLFLFEQHEDGAGNLFVIDGDDFVDVAGDKGQGKVAGAADGDTIGDRGFGRDGDRSARFASAQHGGVLLGFDADDADLGVGLFERAADAADEPAAADGHDYRLNVGDLLEQLEGDGALSGDDVGIVEGVDEGAAFFDAAAHGFFVSFVVVGAVEYNFCAVGSGGGDLDLGSGERHDNLGADASGAGVEGDSLRVITGTGGDDASLTFGFAQGEELVESAAFFK